MDIDGWLRSLGLEQYAAAFRDNAIDEKVLPRLTAEDLKDLGVGLVGHRRTLLDAIAALRADANAKEPFPSDASRMRPVIRLKLSRRYPPSASEAKSASAATSRIGCDVKRFEGIDGCRLRIGDWRVIFIEDARSITVIAVGNRKEIYD